VNLRPSLEIPWPTFVTEWCLGVEPTVPREELTRAFEALDRLWPEYLYELETSGNRGLLYVHAAALVGSILASCEPLDGFAPVLERVRGGERAALSELIFADALVGLDILPHLEPAVGKNKVDVGIPYAGETVFAEVVTPGRSDAIREAQEQINNISRELLSRSAGFNVELLLTPTAALGSIADIAAAVGAAPVSEAVQELPGIGRLLKGPAPATPVFQPSIPCTDPGPVLGTGGAEVQSTGVVAMAAVRLPIGDQRAQRVLAAELHHLQPEQTNLLRMDVTQVIGGSGGWRDLILRCFQPGRNRRIGAVILFEGSSVGTKVERWERWLVLRNPHAYRKPPEDLLEQIEKLDYGRYPPTTPRRRRRCDDASNP
jgi:hypothetical protein